MKAKSREALIAKMHKHEEKANECYEQIKAMEGKERLIGFKNTNDDRLCTDGVYMVVSRRTYIEP
jgi:hypothetical protein